ncbi:cadherin-86C isoform X1 [Wyeomyia smithii]|uniref:cadherin-86C isoform X1 n=1 Tax=Wyeomyia smithii TaxID=174621 RepID=UPI002467BCE9|nr:cadherin-86C isoform X1 [Wyeomyia smithii]XP_055535499.1 cadherin-86C isoform X1 [Wyeomyia smithii]XP_055535577.1 cadherin-86C isoform X1 [Wyeomyia smithii]XP_055535665.1 cadherin-86C isoform X1 [Wyeomyia smithii]
MKSIRGNRRMFHNGGAVFSGSCLVLLLGLLAHRTAGLDPKFDPSTRMRLVLVPADATVGSVIYRLRATDEEFEYPLQFELVGDAASSTVQIETLPCTKFNSICQANVILTRRLEAGRYYDFQVSVKDTKGGMSVQACSITATNFTTPHDLIFPHKTGIIMVPEDSKKGTELDYVLANRNPLQQKPVYLELWGSPLFAIRQKIVSTDMTEGTIFLLGPLDFEKQAMYHLTVLANDAYAEPGQDSRNIAGLEVVIIVEDVQDVPPVFTVAPPVTRLSPGLIPGDKVLQVHAEDGDKGVPREIRYGLVSEGNPFTSFFEINETSGEISLLRPLDDILALTHVGDPVLLTVIAEEVKVSRDEPPAMATTVQLAFFLPERSNSPPYFENDHYVTRLEENAAPGTTLSFTDPYTPRVMDDDAGKNGVFSLTLIGNNGTFEISPNVAEGHANFVIRVRDNSLLDYETAEYVHFQILAQELGPATNLSASVNVTVYLSDVNDNPPVFEQNDYIVDLPENMTAGTRVVQVHATDVDTGLGGKIRYTHILGPQNTSLNLDPTSGVITVAFNNHGFDREAMPEYHLYVEARDDDGVGNRAQVLLVIRLIDVNDETPIFEKSLYEFILSSNLRNFTVPAYIKAIDNDAEAPNNEVRYELIYGNYENKFELHPITGELKLTSALVRRNSNVRQRRQPTSHQLTTTDGGTESDVFVLTARAFDLGVPVRFSTTTIRVYPPESRTRTMTFIVPGHNPDRARVQETLADVTGGRVIIQEIRPYNGNVPGATDIGGNSKDRSVVLATILYDGESVVDIARIQQRLSANGTVHSGISQDERSAILYKAENRVLFWLLIFLAILLALGILTLLLCCICPWCPLYAATRKRVIRVNSIEDDVHLVHREQGIGKQSKSVQVAEWMGRREAWSADRSSDSRTKPTRWEFRGRRHTNKASLAAAAAAAGSTSTAAGRDNRGHTIDDDDDARGGGGGSSGGDGGRVGRVRKSVTEVGAKTKEQTVKIRNEYNSKSAKNSVGGGAGDAVSGDGLHRSRSNLLNNEQRTDMYIEDVDDHDPEYQSLRRVHQHQQLQQQHQTQIDDDSMRRHEMDRGSDLNYERRGSFRRQGGLGNNGGLDDGIEPRDQYYIKEGNAEILRLITRGRNEEENIYVNVPQRGGAGGGVGGGGGQYIMVDNGGKEILMRRYIEEQANGKQIIREHYQLLPGTTFIQTMPNEVPGGYRGEHVTEVKIGHDQKTNKGSDRDVDEDEIHITHAVSNHSLIQQELESSLKQQNALLRQILLEKEKLEEKYNQQDQTLETQSLPCQSMAVVAATQTDCETATQTEPVRIERRRTKSENDDSLSEDEYEYIKFSPPDSPDGVYLIKRKRTRKKTKYKAGAERDSSEGRSSNRRFITVESVKRKIRTPIQEEDEPKRSPPKHAETRASILRRKRNEERLKKDVLMEISDSLEDKDSKKKEKRKKVYKKNVKYYDDSDGSDKDVAVQKYFSADSLDEINSDVEDYTYSVTKTSKSVTVSPRAGVQQRISRRDNKTTETTTSTRIRLTSSESPSRSYKGQAPKPPRLTKSLSKEGLEAQDGKDIPAKYMDWYYNLGKDDSLEKKSKQDKKPMKKKVVSSSSKEDDAKFKPEPMPRTSPPKDARLLKEDIQLAKRVQSQSSGEQTSHPLLQHSEHRFEAEYDPNSQVPPPPDKLPHYMYPATPPIVNRDNKVQIKIVDSSASKPSPIKEHEVKEPRPRPTDSQPPTKILNASTLEDDHDSGIAMNSLLHNKSKRHPITDKKSIFTIAYDDVRIRQIRSESDTPPFS